MSLARSNWSETNRFRRISSLRDAGLRRGAFAGCKYKMFNHALFSFAYKIHHVMGSWHSFDPTTYAYPPGMSGSARCAFVGDEAFLEASSDSIFWVMIMHLSAQYAMHSLHMNCRRFGDLSVTSTLHWWLAFYPMAQHHRPHRGQS